MKKYQVDGNNVTEIQLHTGTNPVICLKRPKKCNGLCFISPRFHFPMHQKIVTFNVHPENKLQNLTNTKWPIRLTFTYMCKIRKANGASYFINT